MSKRLLMLLVCVGVGVAGLWPMLRSAPAGGGASPAGGVPPPVPPATMAHVESGQPPLRVEVTEIVRVSPDVVEFRLAVTNLDRAAPVDVGDLFADQPAERGSLSGAFLSTAGAAARYYVLRGSDGSPICSRDLLELAAGERREAWIGFTSPDRPAAHVTLQLTGMPPLEDLAVPEPS